MFTTYIKQLQHRFARLFYIHLVISIYSFLILVCWGLPFCPLSFFGNLLFNPVLVVFLGLCILLFFAELCFIPNSYIIYLLELVSSWWLYILRLGSTNACNIAFTKPSYLLVTTMMCAGFVIVVHNSTYQKKNIYLLLVLCGGFWFMSQAPKQPDIHELPCTQGNIYLVSTDQEITVIDPGYLGRYASASSYIEYTLIPLLAQQHGTQTIDHLILLQPGQILFEAIAKLLEKTTIKNIYLPVWKGDGSKKMLYFFMRMKDVAAEKQCTMHRLIKPDYVITKHPEQSITLTQLKHQATSSQVTYESYSVTGTIDKKPFTIYPAKYTSQILKHS